MVVVSDDEPRRESGSLLVSSSAGAEALRGWPCRSGICHRGEPVLLVHADFAGAGLVLGLAHQEHQGQQSHE
jgi:hypothetical protein